MSFRRRNDTDYYFVFVRNFLRLRAIPILLARALWVLSYPSRQKTTERWGEITSEVGKV